MRGLYDLLPMLGRRPDVVHHEWANDPAALPWRQRALGVPSVVSCRGLQTTVDPYDPRRPQYRTQLARALQAADRVHCVSDFMAGEARSLGAPTDAIRVIRPAVDLSSFAPQALRPIGNPVRLVNVANLRWVKGLEYLLLAVHELRRRGRDVALDLIGEGKVERERLEGAVHDLSLAVHVRFLGRLDQAGVVEALAGADVMVHPSLSEGLPNSVIEAMAVGVPVVATDVGGVRELLEDGVHALLVPPRDPPALADAVERMVDDDDLRARIVAARDRVAGGFDVERQADEWAELYRELARLPKPLGPIASLPRTGLPRPSQSRPRRAARVVAVGPFGWRGGLDLAVEAFRQLPDALDLELVIAGWGTATGEVGFLRHDLGLDDRVEIRCAADAVDAAQDAVGSDVVVHLLRDHSVDQRAIAPLLRSTLRLVTTDERATVGRDPATTQFVPIRDAAAPARAIVQLLGSLDRAVPSTRAP